MSATVFAEDAMELAHETALDDVLRDVCDFGVATVEVRLLLRWHERKNLSKAVWRDLQQRFERVLHEREKSGQGCELVAMLNDRIISLLCRCPASGQNGPVWLPVAQLAELGTHGVPT